jgi:hypothetical protein
MTLSGKLRNPGPEFRPDTATERRARAISKTHADAD